MYIVAIDIFKKIDNVAMICDSNRLSLFLSNMRKTDSFDSSDFSARKEMIEAGYLAGQQAVPALRTLLNLKT